MRVLLAICLASACAPIAGTFPCATSEQCRDGSRQGVCEPAGFCAFADPSCTGSGLRFDPSAGNNLANACVGADVDAGVDGASDCLAQWMTGTVHFGAPADAGINSTSDDRDPFETYDELNLYFSTKRSGNYDIYLATRTSKTASYGMPARVMEMNSPGTEAKVSLTFDGLDAALSSNGFPGGQGGDDIFESTRSSTSQNFGMFGEAQLGHVDTANDELDARITMDGTRLYMSTINGGMQQLAVATRVNTSSQFGTPVLITELDSGGDADPTPSLDERILVFTSRRTSAFQGTNLWYATRATTTVPFGTPQLVPDLETDNDEGDPHLSPDGCTLYFTRSPVGANSNDILVAKVSN